MTRYAIRLKCYPARSYGTSWTDRRFVLPVFLLVLLEKPLQLVLQRQVATNCRNGRVLRVAKRRETSHFGRFIQFT